VCEVITVTQLKHARGIAPANTRRERRKMKLVMTTNSFNRSYQHTQTGILIVAVMFGMAFVTAVLALLMSKVFWLTVFFLALVAWLFHSLTIEITDRTLGWQFGPGWIRKSVPLADIVSAAPVRTGLSWGIHWSPRLGWLYNVSGWDAVLITLRNGKKFTLGTDEPQLLATRLAEALPAKPPTSFKA